MSGFGDLIRCLRRDLFMRMCTCEQKGLIQNVAEKAVPVAAFLLVCSLCGELREIARPTQLLCEDKPVVRDLGPPEGCTDVPGTHSRLIRVASLGSSTSTASYDSVFVSMPLVAFSAHDADEPGASSGGDLPPLVTIFPSTSVDGALPTPRVIVEPGKGPPRKV
jgi:hypothetical protein